VLNNLRRNEMKAATGLMNARNTRWAIPLGMAVIAYGWLYLVSAMAAESGTPGKVAASFEQLDLNGDHLLSPDEAKAVPGLPEKFGELDIEHDGMLNRTEFSQFVPATQELSVQIPAAQSPSFDELDVDGDKLISPEEAKAVPGLAEKIPELDIEHDGMLNRTEFSKFKPATESTGKLLPR
jgi:hypothetical protein